jgi:acyl-CoA thioester hydrolase
MTGGDWQVRLRMQLRWNDFDRYGHLNHAIYDVFMAEGRVALMESLTGGSMEFVLVRIELDYRREVSPSEDHVVVVGRIADVGGKSVTIEQQILKADGTVAAETRAVVVAWDGGARSAREISDHERAALTQAPEELAAQ